jgi:hypothetical protein
VAAAGREWRLRNPPVDSLIVHRADSVGEAAWAERVLLPLIDLAPTLPDMTERDERTYRFSQEPPLDADDKDHNDSRVRFFVHYWALRYYDARTRGRPN